MKCEERGKLIDASRIIKHCLSVMNEIKSSDKSNDKDSDEEDDDDISLEDLSPSERKLLEAKNKKSTYTMAIPGVLVILFVIIGGVVIYQIYKRRKKFHRRLVI